MNWREDIDAAADVSAGDEAIEILHGADVPVDRHLPVDVVLLDALPVASGRGKGNRRRCVAEAESVVGELVPFVLAVADAGFQLHLFVDPIPAVGEDGPVLFLVDPGAGEPGKVEVRVKGTADEVESAPLPGWKLGILFLPEQPERPPERLIVRREQVEFLGVELGVDVAVEDIDVAEHRRADRCVQVEIVRR